MKGHFSRLILAATLLFPITLFAAQTTAIATAPTAPTASAVPTVQAYTLDPTHTFVLFHINHMGFSNQVGKWQANGALTLDETALQNSKVNVTIQVADIVTGIDKLNEHLKGDQFFDVTHFPTATFVSNKVTVTGKNTAKVDGALTLHGVTKPVTLNVKINKIAVSPITQKKTVGFSATTQIKRSDYGIMAYLPGLADEVKLNIEGEAN
jgi:polyisoprenoid-binding protein YceI